MMSFQYKSKGEIQDYPFCFNFEVTGGGTAQPTGIKYDELYKPDDRAFTRVVDGTPFKLPGPPIFVDSTD
jgi:hypothetical protein